MNRKRTKSKVDRTMPMVHPNAAAIDVGATIHMAAVSADRTPEPVRSFGTFTTDLHRLVNWFKECGVETGVMESTSVYWIPIFELTEAGGFIVFLVKHSCGTCGKPPPSSGCKSGSLIASTSEEIDAAFTP